jgi:hypothetical protein
MDEEILTLAASVFVIAVLSIDFVFTSVFWLTKPRLQKPHIWWKYHLMLGLLGAEATIVTLLLLNLLS